jgi:hypothetical protein
MARNCAYLHTLDRLRVRAPAQPYNAEDLHASSAGVRLPSGEAAG